MGKKKVKPSAFGEFMSEYMSKERHAGRKYPKVIANRIVIFVEFLIKLCTNVFLLFSTYGLE